MTPAQPPSPDFLLQLLLAAVLVGNVASIWIGLLNRKNIQKREVSFEFTPASKEDFDQHVRDTHENFVQIRNELKEDRQQNQVHASARAASLYKKIDEVRAELSAKVETMPDRVITQLRNTKGLLS